MNELSTQGAFSSAANFESAQRMAKALCSSSMVPTHYQGDNNIGNAIIALEIAQRMDVSPLMTMQNLYIVHGTPGWSSKFLIATFNQCGKFSAIRYEWKGTAGQKDRACRAYAYEKQTNERVDGPWIDWQLINGEGWAGRKGSKWKTMPEKMFAYRAAAWMIDTVAPELSMGFQSADQLQDLNDPAKVVSVVDKTQSFKDALNPIDDQTVKETPVIDSNGEEFDHAHHSVGRNGRPVFNQDGSFRARRGSRTNDHTEKPAQESQTGDPEFSFAQIAELLNAAQNQDQVDEAMSLMGGLPESQKIEIEQLAEHVIQKLAA